MMEAQDRHAPGLSPEARVEMAYAWSGRTREAVRGRAFEDPGAFVRRYRDRPEDLAALADAGQRRVLEDPTLRERALGARGLRRREGTRDPEEGVRRDIETYFGYGAGAGREILDYAGRWYAWRLGDIDRIRTAQARLEEFGTAAGDPDLLERDRFGRAVGVRIERYGMVVHQHFGGSSASRPHTSGRPRIRK